MTTYNTGNPVGSTEVKDLYDNAQNLDNLVNGPGFAYEDRLGNSRKSWAGMEQDFNQFLLNSQFELPPLVYVDSSPLVVDRPTQVIERAGQLYRVLLPASFPVNLTGTWATDELLLTAMTDSDLRIELDELAGSALRGDLNREYNVLIGVIAANGGPLAFLDDSGHQPTGFSLTISQPNTYSTQLNFLENAGHVGTFVVVPDESYAQNGIAAGCSVFTDRAVIQASAPLTLKYAGFNAITSTPLWNSGGLITNTLMPNGGVKIGHPQALSNSAPVVTPLQTTGMAGTELVITDYTDNDVTVCAVDDMNGFISFNGTTWAQSLSNNVVAPASIVFSGGNLTITHADVGTNNYNVSLGPFGTPYQVVVANVSATTIIINFYNAAGTLVTVADTNMKFFYRRNAKVVRNLTGVAFSLNRGQCLIPNTAYENIPSGNFWIYGVNQRI